MTNQPPGTPNGLSAPPARFRYGRALNIAFRTAHIGVTGVLCGGHVFAIPPEQRAESRRRVEAHEKHPEELLTWDQGRDQLRDRK